MSKCKTDAEWQKTVKIRCEGRCEYPGCTDDAIHACHIITRGDMDLRLDPDNGIGMCAPHHIRFDKLSSYAHKKMAKLIAGDVRYNALNEQADR